MTDYGHDLLFGTFVTPTSFPAQQAIEQAVVADRAGLDLVTFQDHPYLATFHDAWTLITYAAARTQHVHLTANVTNLPLRPPATLARAVATADRLSGGRIELGLGAGAFWDGIESMGGTRLSPGESIAALEEAVSIIRGVWDTDDRRRLTVDGTHHKVTHVSRGPAPAHRPDIWIGAYKPRILRTTGRVADGWLPSIQYLPGGIDDLTEMNEHIDEGAAAAGREPNEVRRLLNISGRFSRTSSGLLQGPPAQWVEQLVEITLKHGTSAYLLASDEASKTERFAHEVAPAVRAVIDQERD